MNFSNINALPFPIDLNRLDEGDGMCTTFMQRKASFHKSCRNKFDNQKLKRAEKRKAEDELPDVPSPVKTRKYFEKESLCIFDCKGVKEELRKA